MRRRSDSWQCREFYRSVPRNQLNRSFAVPDLVQLKVKLLKFSAVIFRNHTSSQVEAQEEDQVLVADWAAFSQSLCCTARLSHLSHKCWVVPVSTLKPKKKYQVLMLPRDMDALILGAKEATLTMLRMDPSIIGLSSMARGSFYIFCRRKAFQGLGFRV